jgi:CelD/BcsL family acetyltransferase involved in cellulose biosynthesis
MAVSGIRVEEVTDLESLAEEWRPLAAAHGDGLPFRTWEWASAWQARFLEQGRFVHDRPSVMAFRSPAGALIAVAPLLLTHRPRGGPLLRILDFHGTDPNLTEVRGALCDPAWEQAVTGALVGRLMARHREWDWLHLRGLRVGSPAHGAVVALPGVLWERETPAYVVRLPSSWEELKARVSRNLKESLRRGYNSLRRDGHAFTLEVARAGAEVVPALERFFALHGARAELEGTVVHRDVFSSRAARDFLRDVCGQLCQQDMVRIFQLRIAGEVVASRVAFAMGDSLYLYYSGYQPSWRTYGVMTTTVAETMRYAIQNGFRSVHLSTGTDVSKTRWRPELVTYRDAILVSPSLRGRAAFRWAAAVRSHPARAPALRLFRRLLGRGFNAR